MKAIAVITPREILIQITRSHPGFGARKTLVWSTASCSHSFIFVKQLCTVIEAGESFWHTELFIPRPSSHQSYQFLLLYLH